jgi:Protein of unknown function (DUF3592)
MWELFKSFNLAGRIGGVVGLLGGLAGAAIAIEVDPLMGTIMAVVIFGILIGGFWVAWRPQVQRNRLAKNGTAAEATILSIRETGWTVQGNYGIAKLTLSVEPPDGGEAYETETRAMINRFDIPAFQPGARVNVVIDPKDPKTVAVV